jgi:hypothetical protein
MNSFKWMFLVDSASRLPSSSSVIGNVFIFCVLEAADEFGAINYNVTGRGVVLIAHARAAFLVQQLK